MSIAVGIARLGGLLERLRHEGRTAAGDLLHGLRDVEQRARAAGWEPLARSCRIGGETIAALAAADAEYDLHAAEVAEHVAQLVDFAARCLQAIDSGTDVAGIVPPPALTLRDAEERRQYAETVAMFVANAIATVGELEEETLALAASATPADAIAGIRRAVHTLKAEFGVLDMTGAQTLCHQAETTIDACVEHGQPFPVEAMLQCADLLERFLERLTLDPYAEVGDVEPQLRALRAVAANAAAGDQPVVLMVGGEFADSVTEFVSEARGHLADAEAAMVALANEPGDGENVNLTFRAFHTIKGVAGFLDLAPMVELAHSAETLLDGCRSQRLAFTADDIDLVLAAGDMIGQMIQSLEGRPGPRHRDWRRTIERLQAAAARADARPVPAAAPAAPESHEARATHGSPATPPARAVLQPQPRPDASPDGDTRPARGERTVKVSTTRLDLLVDMVGELVIAQAMVLQDPAIRRLDNQSLARNIGQVGKITRDLQEAAMSLRMVTVKATFQKMARLVRDVAGKAGKRVALVLHGEDTELDRNVVEQIADPLVHMIRNAIDHGIEGADERRAAGKPAEGRLTLSAYHQGGSIVIEIEDDGRGLDRARIVDKAVDKGLLPGGTGVGDLSPQQIHDLIFVPGFSTAEQITDLSGRGVGMDVVRRNIESLRGRVEIDSELGAGTTFRLRLPLTLAIIDGMVVRVGSERYVLPTLAIEHSFRPVAADLHHLVDRGECVRVRGAVLPVHRLKELFAQGDGLDDVAAGILVVVEADGRRCCLFVDEILGQQQVVIKSLGLARERVVGLSGGAIMTDGRVALILDVGTLIDCAVARPEHVR